MIRHFAHLIRPDGGISALCFLRPRAINLKKASWTNRSSAVTCGKCLEVIKRQKTEATT